MESFKTLFKLLGTFTVCGVVACIVVDFCKEAWGNYGDESDGLDNDLQEVASTSRTYTELDFHKAPAQDGATAPMSDEAEEP